MIKKIFVVISIMAVFALLVWPSQEEVEAEVSVVKVKQPATVEHKSNLQKSTANLPGKSPQKHKVTTDYNSNLAKAAEQIAIQYESALKYPPYSQPLSEFDEDRLKPNQFYPVESPIDDKGNAVTISLSKYRFVYPEEITLKVSAGGLKNVIVELANTDTKEIVTTYKSNAREGEANVIFKAEEDYPRNLQIFVEANVDGKQIPVVAQIQYMPPSATLLGFESAYPQNENMLIPANLKVAKKGLYRLRANLFSGDTPLAHLVSKQRLSKGSQTIDLKAHWSILPQGMADMRLSGFVIERMSPSPGERNSFGNSEVSHFDINDFPYDSLQQLPYQPNEQEKLSLEFLQGLAEG
ncbi:MULTISPECIES: hypothetical protein [unclassified Pseudoalteromonas]|uniref:hypothetical protein n=1 Tax=unclassified Pseudoalteromonas TaxID=194690 RepID=UPI0009E94026|nr:MULTISPECIES: hypothetical protein [unclassified Pseudoalteromonas]TMN78568.1 hypothetical protein CWB64_15835 [Pseudoalteromonas sp. S410]TMN88704.1 hypothetical protein CWB62_14910 [Pseudoalteromonas sp. S408]TMN96579.1 hypothetical protein CWB61_11595 [Pseudoalteromonas sp. S407]TMN97222.1 hypothetical protein CWB63_14155 [Pseudoalteromonas sp. S409]TMO11655.1 hypothetical protein CWB57_06040 [Pseudoalteromonas sp. S186]|tara:strand:+ start:679 stop:1734 length:1056 start_codon:yes stop_codon:yes gene_type:complete